MAQIRNEKKGVLKLGLVGNLNTYLDDLIDISSEECNKKELHDKVDLWADNRNEFLNKYGYSQDRNNNVITKRDALYLRFETDLLNSNGEKIFGLYTKTRQGYFKGIEWKTDAEIQQYIKTGKLFNMGKIFFDLWDDGQSFLQDMADCTIPESWKYKNKPSKITNPILKSYLENTFERLIIESSKIIYSSDKKYIVFNTNLLDKYFHEVLVVAEVRIICEKELYFNPVRPKSKRQLVEYGFQNDVAPMPPKYFECVDDVVFHTNWVIDTDFDKFTHIIEERRERFPEHYKNDTEEQLARKLDDAIKYAIAIAQRNYKFIVPMYRPQKNAIQLLMPIYLSGTYNRQPDFALILTPDKEAEIYIPETILSLDAVYQNARLIAKPDESWLNPDIIL